MRRLYSRFVVLGMVACVPSALAQTTFTAELDGRQGVPPANSQATGTCTGTLSADESEFTFSCTHDVNSATDGHIHGGAFGITGDVVFEFAEGECCPDSTTWMLTADDAAALKAGNLYVNIHSVIFSVEEIRGQLLADDEGSDVDGDTVEDATFSGACGSLGGFGMLLLFGGLLAMRLNRSRD